MSPHAFLPPFSLSGQTALVTGGGSGLGEGMARCLVQAGARVILTGRDRDKIQRAAAELGGDALAHPVDLLNPESFEALRRFAEEESGGIDLFISNAGVHLKKPAEETTWEELETVLRTHVVGAHELLRRFLPGMRTRGTGAVILVSSMTAYMGMPRVIAYTAAKSALAGMVRAYSSELAPDGIRVNGIAPGWIESPMLRKAIDGDRARSQRILQRTHLGRFGDPEDIGWAAVYLASPAARFITGITLAVDGGASVGF